MSKRRSLTQEELDLQDRRGALYKKIVTKVTGDFAATADADKMGIFLSGGADSTTTLWALLNQGYRPSCYTFHLPTSAAISTDARKAQALAERYDLPFTIVKMPDDPDELAKMIWEMNDRYSHFDMIKRADFEVLPIFQVMMEQAAEDGMTHVFSGIEDCNIHIAGRKLEIRGRSDEGVPTPEANARRIFSIGTQQSLILTSIATDLGLNLCLPLCPAAAMFPYHNVPWDVMNIPSLKEITLRQWRKEEADSGVTVVVSSLQNGDAGGRVYYDSKLTESQYASRLAERDISSAQVFYNYMKRIRDNMGISSVLIQWNYFAYVTAGRKPDAAFARDLPSISDPETGRAPLPEGYETDPDELSPFGDFLDDESDWKLDESGEPDTRVDCLGLPFYLGDDSAMTACPRAMAGHCGKWKPDVPYSLEECEVWDSWVSDSIEYLESIADVSLDEAKSVYLKWFGICTDNASDIKNKICDYSGDKL